YRRLGERRLRRADVRFVAATNADLETAVREGRFRADLFFRLRVIPLVVPALRDRLDDIDPLTDEFVAHYAAAYGVPPVVFAARASGKQRRTFFSLLRRHGIDATRFRAAR